MNRNCGLELLGEVAEQPSSEVMIADALQPMFGRKLHGCLREQPIHRE